ncbi:SDR family oxidoreductase [Nocardia brasiliensis]|uniref:SDR family oxidoreductase n=1 Tax=Nocardia brasiliensis TaxID=37326 RepID=UPI0024577E5B|nr:SDR family oxidoreductase [Nocardia brasiliensis]
MVYIARICEGQSLDAQTKAQFEALISCGKMGPSEEIATDAVVLASEDSSFVNGMEPAVDGGTSAL